METVDKRLGIKIPRTVLLPPYLAMNEYFVEYTQSIDEVFQSLVDDKIRVIENIRNMWVTNPVLEQKVLDHEMIDFSDWSQPERELLVRQVNMLGMKLKSAGVLSNDDYHVISRFVGQYWFGKGTQAFIEFINFCLVVDLKVHRLWAEDQGDEEYHNFTRDVDGQPPGPPIWEGGVWYPTTHVEIEAKGGLGDLSNEVLAEFFYEIANFNLVLNAIDSSQDLPIVGGSGSTATDIVAVGVLYDELQIMSTEGRFGADSPPVTTLANGLPLTIYGTNDVMVTTPTGWFLDNDSHTFMVFDVQDRTNQNVTSLPSVVVGNLPSVPTNPTSYVMLSGPDDWIKVPGSSRSAARIPIWNGQPVAVQRNYVPATIIGRQLQMVTNPTGWYEVTPGKFTPYW